MKKAKNRDQRELLDISGYKGMWLYTMYDLPVFSKKARHDYSVFHKYLLSEGFIMLQYSVYARYCKSEEAAKGFRNRIRQNLPPNGQIRILYVTDIQFGKQEVYYGKSAQTPEEKPNQLLLF